MLLESPLPRNRYGAREFPRKPRGRSRCATRSWHPQSSRLDCRALGVRRNRLHCEKFLQPVSRATSRLGGRWKISSFGAEGGDAATRKDEQLLAQSVRLFDVVRHEQCRPPVFRKRFLKLRFHLTSQVRVERRERFVQQQRLRVRLPAPAPAPLAAARRLKARADNDSRAQQMCVRSN